MKVKCVDCGNLFDINMTGYKNRVYTCPNPDCHSNEHEILNLKEIKKGEIIMVNEASVRQALMQMIYKKVAVEEKDMSMEELQSLVDMYIGIIMPDK